jgi:beta-barrel assembly-enhancing protease
MSRTVSQPLAFQTRALMRRLLCLTVLLLATLAYPQSARPEFPNPGNAHMSRDNQQALGMQAAAQVYQQMPVLPDNSPETQYIRQLGQKLVATIPSEYSWPFEFHVVAQKEINAFALPGGQMFVNIGTITAASNEAELAGVMAHEMSHVYMQHSAKQAYKAEWTQGLAELAGGVLGATTGGLIGQLGQMGIQMTEQGLILKYSRSDADAVGAIILYQAGYDPQAMADLDVLQLSGWLASDVKESRNGNPTGDLQMAAERTRHHPLCRPLVSSLLSFATRC